MKRRTAILGTLALANLGSSLAIQIYVLAKLGPGGGTDAFFASSTLPQLILAVLIGSAVNVIVPFFSGRVVDREFSEDAWSVLAWIMLLLTCLAVGVALSAEFATELLLPGLSNADQAQAVRLTQIGAISLPFAGVSLVASGIHQGLGRYVRAESIAAATNVLTLPAALLILPNAGLAGVAWVLVGRSVVQAVCLAPGLGAFVIKPNSQAVRVIEQGMRPLLLSTSYFKLSPLLDRFLASFGVPGDISLLNLIQQIFAGAAALFGKSVVAPLTGSLATDYKRGVDRGVRLERYLTIHRTTALLAVLAVAFGLGGLLVSGGWLFPNHLAARALPLLIAMAGVYTAGFLGQLAAAWFYAEGETRFPARVGAIGFTTAIVSRLLLFPWLGVAGIAAANSLNQILNWLLLHRAITKRPAS